MYVAPRAIRVSLLPPRLSADSALPSSLSLSVEFPLLIMSDVRDVLGISGSTPNANATAHATRPAPGSQSSSRSDRADRDRDVPRELQQLGWGGGLSGAGGASAFMTPTIMAPTPPLGQFKARRVKAVSWKYMPIRSSARTALTGKDTDDLDLHHWVKIHNVPDYMFARFHKVIKLLEYTNDEYDSYLDDPLWSRPETDRLMELAKRYDLRFIIMEDRYNSMSQAAEAKRKEETIPKVDLERIKRAEKLLHEKSPKGEAKEEEAPVATPEKATIAVSANTSMSIPNEAASQDSSSAPMDVDATGASPPAPITVVGAGVILPSVHANDGAATFPSILPSTVTKHDGADANGVGLASGIFPPRTVEELKSRFYSIQQTLTQLRNASDPDLKKSNPLFTHPYDVPHELLRKAQLERLYQRKTDDIDQMAQIVLEHREISAQIKKIKKAEKESRDAARGYKTGSTKRGSAASSGVGSSVGAGSAPNALAAGSTKKKSGSTKRVAGAVGVGPGGAPAQQLPIVLGELAPLPASCDAANVIPTRPSGTVYLRSTQLAHATNANPKQLKHLENELLQLGIRRAKDLPVPTGVVCELWDKLRVNILTLVNLQQYVRDKETMRDDLKAHAATIPNSNLGSASLASGGGGGSSSGSIHRQSSVDGGFNNNPAGVASSAQAAAQAQAAMRKKQEKRRLEGEPESDDKRQKVKK